MLSTFPALLGIVVQAQIVAPLPRVPLPKPAPNVARAVVHSNRIASGRLVGNTLRLELDVLESAWKPEGNDDPEVPVLAFAERGSTPRVPGPMVRVRRGTNVWLTLRNRSDSALVIGGLRPGSGLAVDTVLIAAGATREVRYTLGAAGTFWYWGAFQGTTHDLREWKDSQLNGAIVVDEPGARTDDQVLLLSEWFHPYDDGRTFEVVSVINGKGWPHSETITLQQGDSSRFRVINTTPLWHPLHLHGFYYEIESQGTVDQDVPVPRVRRHLSNTDLIRPGGTVMFGFLASTPGNWLFHCHFASHADDVVSLAGSPRDTAEAAAHAARVARMASGEHAAATHSMRGLVIGIRVAPRPGYVEDLAANARELRLFVGRKPNVMPLRTDAVGFSLQEGTTPPARDSVVLPGPVLALKRGEPVRIIVRNQLDEPTSIHWHGLEIESFPDGVPHFSGLGARIYTQIAPGDSFVAAFTPPRSGTFPYHSHLNDRHHINAGMYGAILVTDVPRDTLHDHLIVAGGGGPELEYKFDPPFGLVNGRTVPRPLRLTIGETHRLRIISIHPNWRLSFF